jgi:pimeloyl-ACP methyl ester carboxylesterase
MTPLVLLHAFPLDAQMYRGVTEHVSGQVVTPDLPGFGGTARPKDDPSLDVYADAVAAELDRIGLGQIVIGGTSMGGYTTMAFCRRHGDRVAGLALIDTKASTDAPEAADGRRAMAAHMEDGRTTEPLLELVFPKLLGATTMSERAEVAELVRGWVRDAPAASAAWAQRAMSVRPDSFDTLGGLDVPAVVVVGAEDVLTPPQEAEAMANALPNAEYVLIERAGHLTPVEATQEVSDALDALMRRVDG